MKWAVRMTRTAMAAFYQIERGIARNVSSAIDSLAENPEVTNIQPSDDDPSVYWIAVEGDVTVWFEILDEDHAIRIVKIE